MKNIRIITPYGNDNYGNKLQNYAVQQYCKKYNFNVETIKNHPISNKGEKSKIKSLLRCIKVLFIRVKEEIERKIKKDQRYKKFKEFNKNLNLSKHFFSNLKVFDRFKEDDIFVVGSDQVWNPNFGNLTSFELVEFAEKSTKIAFSASFGVSELPEECKERTAKALKKFKAISVREDAGKKIVEELTGRNDIRVLVDPTMLLDAEEWKKLEKKPKQLKAEKYILNYFLGNISDKKRKEIERIAMENNCEIINILDEKSPFYSTGPSEFLYLERNAFLICTDSFHSCVFAILYNRPFVVFDRDENIKSMNSRIDTLLSKFKLQDRFVKDNKIKCELLKCDFKHSYKILENERKIAKNFFENAIN